MTKLPTDKSSELTYREMLKSPSKEFIRVVTPFYRSEAAKTIQQGFRRWRNSHYILTNFKSPRYSSQRVKLAKLYWSARHQKFNLNHFRLPVDVEFQKTTQYCIKNHQYDRIPYAHPDFTRHLFATFHADLITMNEMITAKLMYESLICFNKGQIPDSPQFKKYRLSDEAGPFRPEKEIENWKELETNQLNTMIAKANQDIYHYYTIDLPHHHIVGFLYFTLKLYKSFQKISDPKFVRNRKKYDA